jgi:hypothetical protein
MQVTIPARPAVPHVQPVCILQRHCWLGQGLTSWSTCFPYRTDFTCCNKEHSYYYGNDNHHDIGLAFNDKVGTCDCKSLSGIAQHVA